MAFTILSIIDNNGNWYSCYTVLYLISFMIFENS